jgi:hypothetical protein
MNQIVIQSNNITVVVEQSTSLSVSATDSIQQVIVDNNRPGPEGPQGIQGIQGPQGPIGPQGPEGTPANNDLINIAYSNAVNFASNLAANAYSNSVIYSDLAVNTAYSNAILVANNLASNAYSNAILIANTLASNAYSNAVIFASNVSNINTGTLSAERLPGNVVFTSVNSEFISVSNNVQTNTLKVITIEANNGLGTNGQILTSNGTVSYWANGGFSNGQSIEVEDLVITGSFTTDNTSGLQYQVLTSNGSGLIWGPRIIVSNTQPDNPLPGDIWIYYNGEL